MYLLLISEDHTSGDVGSWTQGSDSWWVWWVWVQPGLTEPGPGSLRPGAAGRSQDFLSSVKLEKRSAGVHKFP